MYVHGFTFILHRMKEYNVDEVKKINLLSNFQSGLSN